MFICLGVFITSSFYVNRFLIYRTAKDHQQTTVEWAVLFKQEQRFHSRVLYLVRYAFLEIST